MDSLSFIQLFMMIMALWTSRDQLVSQACLQLTENTLPVLFCQSSVPRLPLASEHIPTNLAKLRILGTSSTTELQHNGHLESFNLTGLETLTYLEISNFNLRYIQVDTFRAMRNLRVLDLSRNRITMIQAGAFNGLSLDLLSLTDNTGLTLARGIFRGAQVYNLAVRNCGLYELDYTTIAEAKAKRLGLSYNQITWLDQRFEKLIKPWASSALPHNSEIMEDWGFIDLTNNPLNCNCQLVWLSRLIEEQVFAAQRSSLKLGDTKAKDSDGQKLVNKENLGETSTKWMYQLNLTCANPVNLAGRPLPQSWDFFCPKPNVVGIDINLLTVHADHAQLTCIGRGQPPPSLAWTYRINGHKVQKTLDITAQPQHTSYETSSFSLESSSKMPNMHQVYERRIALNVSLKEPTPHNFTCTVWNDDVPKTQSAVYPFDAIDRFQPNSLDVSGSDMVSTPPNYRMHEVTVRIHGPSKSFPVTLIDMKPSDDQSRKEENNQIINENVMTTFATITTETMTATSTTSTYHYLFSERFSLLQLLGAVFGTFVVTLALLYSVTHFLSCFCQFPQFPSKEFHRPPPREKAKRPWFQFTRKSDSSLTGSSRRTDLSAQVASERAPLNEQNFTKTANCDSVFSLLTSGTNGHNSNAGPSTVCQRRQPIPQALLLTGMPVPSVDRSATPPPNPAYWSMPEYAYTGTGSHEYDVPRPLEPLFNNKSVALPGLPDPHTITSPGTTHSFMSLTNPSLIPGTSRYPFTDNGIAHNSALLHSATTLNPFINNWSNTTNHGGSMMNSLFNWNQIGATTGLAPHADRQLPSVSYTQYPSTHSVVYGGEYPTYLQTRPYPHHQHQIKPLLELVTHSSKQFTLPSVSAIDNGLDGHQTFGQAQESAHPSGSHTTETNSSLNGSTS
ncbi:hypothetical protein EG68_02261 [Paragonimus skrjabini miyazakii]|uniref:Ig-like domain-containing protein n=1 Tax=Paragonimus skrjabini miyazakii TaxID=59628 RepID=A0A8S9Z3U3_9TREM|nr:hypothetical protein EG68_02261 [Paragonimus skrjabini miyazakii]